MSACGTVFNGGSQDIQIDSNVKGVEVFVNGMRACKTPCVLPLERSSSAVVLVAKKRGYEEQQMTLKRELSSVAILNLTFWPSWLTDVATGGMWKYNRDGLYIEMENSNDGYYNHGYQQQYNQPRTQQRYYDRYSKNDETGATEKCTKIMAELEKIGRVVEKAYPGVNRETWLVIDASTGQNAVSQAKLFDESTGLTGLVLTKLDGTAKGGVVVSIAKEQNIPVKFVGVGEAVEDIQPFMAEDFAEALFSEVK